MFESYRYFKTTSMAYASPSRATPPHFVNFLWGLPVFIHLWRRTTGVFLNNKNVRTLVRLTNWKHSTCLSPMYQSLDLPCLTRETCQDSETLPPNGIFTEVFNQRLEFSSSTIRNSWRPVKPLTYFNYIRLHLIHVPKSFGNNIQMNHLIFLASIKRFFLKPKEFSYMWWLVSTCVFNVNLLVSATTNNWMGWHSTAGYIGPEALWQVPLVSVINLHTGVEKPAMSYCLWREREPYFHFSFVQYFSR